MPYYPIPDQLVWTSNPESGLGQSLYMRKNVLAFTTHLALLPFPDRYLGFQSFRLLPIFLESLDPSSRGRAFITPRNKVTGHTISSIFEGLEVRQALVSSLQL
jgi:hypothetical protein